MTGVHKSVIRETSREATTRHSKRNNGSHFMIVFSKPIAKRQQSRISKQFETKI